MFIEAAVDEGVFAVAEAGVDFPARVLEDELRELRVHDVVAEHLSGAL